MKKIILLVFLTLPLSVAAKNLDLNKMIRTDFAAYIINETMYTQTVTYRKCKVYYNLGKKECELQQTLTLLPYTGLSLGDSSRTLPDNTWNTYQIDNISNNTMMKEYMDNENALCETSYLRNIILINDYDSNDVFCSIATESP